jgi:hypothetical protein
VTVFVERIDSEKSLRTISNHDAGQDNQDQSGDMSRHGFPVSWGYPVNIGLGFIEIAARPKYCRASSRHRICDGFFIELPLLSGGRRHRCQK